VPVTAPCDRLIMALPRCLRRPSASAPAPDPCLLRVAGSDEQPDASRKCHVEVERAAKAVDVVETDTVGVTTNRPNQDDVMGESASIVASGRDIHSSYSPAVDRQRTERTNPSARIPGRAIDHLRVASKRSRRGRDDEMLIVRFARTNHPPSPRSRANRRADDVKLTSPDASGRDQPFRHSRWTRNGVANLVGRGPALPAKFR
jgi:hypothetical protein